MSEVFEKLPDFPGFAVRYDPKEKPYFKMNCVEDLRRIASDKGAGDLKTLGTELLKLIADAKPKHRGDFPASINVIMIPTSVDYTQTGYTDLGGKMYETPGRGKAGCNFWKRRGGSSNAALDASAASNGTGSVCHMSFTNAQMMTGHTTAANLLSAHASS